MRHLAPLLLITALFATPPLAMSDTLLLDAIAETPANSTTGILRPARGQTMEQVYDKFGQAQQEMPAIGKPPITRWIYKNFTVYFEYDRVIDTVIHR